MSRIRFGTDGVRGIAGQYPIDAEGSARIGRGVASWAWGEAPPRVLIIRDTRKSGPELEAAVCRGIVSQGGVAVRGGVLPTAAASCALALHGLDAAVVLTASHNPWTDNGLKVLARGGGKVLDPAALEMAIAAPRHPAQRGHVEDWSGGEDAWASFLPQVDLSGLRLLLDSASGAGFRVARTALLARGADVVQRDPLPDGENINQGTGALHPPSAAEVRERGCSLAICLDGDADRVMLVDGAAGLLDGDDILWLLSQGDSKPVVGTVMSNGGLEAALGERFHRAKVGDRHVAELMQRTSAPRGAEPSGHVLFSDGMPTGDGLYTALRVLGAVSAVRGSLLPLPTGGWTRWPQASESVRFSGERVPLDDWPSLRAVSEAGNRSVVRYSGTEPKLRVLVEGMGVGAEAPRVQVAAILAEFHKRLAQR